MVLKMLCNSCRKRQATVFWEQTAGGDTARIALCSECASKNSTPSYVSPDRDKGIFLSFIPLASPDVENKACSLCSSTLSEIMASGKFGFPECYEVFKEELSAPLRVLHGSLSYAGRMPKKLFDRKERKRRLDELNEKLRAALEREEYESCPAIRDEIKAILQGI